MIASTACEALRRGKRLELRYDGFTRVVEVHAVGTAENRNEVMRVWQVRGGSQSGERQGWKSLRFDKTFSAVILDNEKSEAPRPGYKRGDKAMKIIRCEI